MINIDPFAPQLGNRLFQLAAAIDLADRNLDQVNYLDWKYNKYFEGLVDEQHITDTNTTVYNEEPEYIYQEPYFAYSPIPYHRKMMLRGYFQSFKYFELSESKIRKIFTIKPEYRINVKSSLSNYIDGDLPIVSISVRRGDYLTLPDYHPVQTQEYYTRAIRLIFEKYGRCKFFIFSDDPEWCYKNLIFSNDVTIVEGNDVITDFSMISSCDHHIIANSTFGLWAAWLNPNKSKTVIAPNNWFGKALAHHDTSTMLPNDWIRI